MFLFLFTIVCYDFNYSWLTLWLPTCFHFVLIPMCLFALYLCCLFVCLLIRLFICDRCGLIPINGIVFLVELKPLLLTIYLACMSLLYLHISQSLFAC